MWAYSYWTENFNKRICKYLIQRYLGLYLQEKLTLDQLTIDISNGTGNVRNVSLDCDALNVLAEEHSLPIEFINGHLECISLSVPWKTLMQDSCEIEVTGMTITIQPKKRKATTSVFDSMWTSMASSIQLATECLQTIDDDPATAPPPQAEGIPGLEQCAEAIDAVFARGKICFKDTTLRVQHVLSKGDNLGIAVEVRIKLLNYADEIADRSETQRNYTTAYSDKKLVLDGLSCYTDIFPLCDSIQNIGNGKSMDESSSSEEEAVLEPIEDNTTVQFAKFAGRHTVKIRIKEDDTIAGPGFILECNFGSLIGFLSPLQLHIVLKLVDEFINPDSIPSAKETWLKSVKEKPMDTFDFRRVEEELQEQIKPGGIGLPGLQRQQGWSSATFDDSDEEFLPFKSKTGMFSSVHSTLMNMSTTSVASSVDDSAESIYSATTSRLNGSPSDSQKSRGLTVSQTPHNTEKTVTLAVTSVLLVLLHDDQINICRATQPGSADDLQKLSDHFFKKVGFFTVAGGKRNADSTRETLNGACTSNHLRLIAAPVKVSATTVTEPVIQTNGHFALGNVELVEFLGDTTSNGCSNSNNCIQILSFANQNEPFTSESTRIDFKYKAYSAKATKTTLKVHLQPCNLEVDISLIDRINAVLQPKLGDYFQSSGGEYGRSINKPAELGSQNVVMIKVDAQSAVVNFRFPIPDLRPANDHGKVPYWVRNVRNDSVILRLKGLKFSTTINSCVRVLELDTICEEVKLFYKENQEEEPTFIAEATSFDDEIESLQMTRNGFDWPRIVVWIYPEKLSDSVASPVNDDPESLEAFLPQKPTETSPFTSRRLVHECMTSGENETESNNESVIPGDRSEMNHFMETASRDVNYKVEMNLRCVTVSLPSKHIFEELYNRFGTDLLLWEPSAPKKMRNGLNENVFQEFKTMSNRHRGEELSGSEDEEEISAFYMPSQPNTFVKKQVQRLPRNGQSQVTFNIAIEKGVCSFFAPFTNTTGGVVPEQKGQFSIKVEEGNIFLVSGYNGNTSLGYVCLYTKRAELYHLDLVRGMADSPPRFGPHVRKTIYPSHETVLSATSHASAMDYSDMLSVAIKIERDTAKNVKNFKVAASIKEGTLDHTVWLPNRSWFTQLVDFFDVLDAPIYGYTPSIVVTELHLHLWNCAIDYSPLNLPLRIILTIENFALSSNIVAQTNTSVISLLAEEAALYLTTNRESVDLKTDYVCVLDMDLFELSLRLCQNRASSAPRVELTASNNVLHMRTCSDSFKYLMDLITYYANDGDLADPQNGSEMGSRDCTPIPEDVSSEAALIETVETMDCVKRITISQTEHLHELVADAMTENNFERSSSLRSLDQENGFYEKNYSTNGPYSIELHFEPNGIEPNTENYKGIGKIQMPTYYEPIMQSSNGLPIEINPDDEDYEEFCLLEDDPGVGILKSNGEPVARVLTDNPIRLIDNYFTVPIGRTDILKPPRHYPNAVMRYSIQDVGIIWHLYGGEDFVSAKGKSPKKDSFDNGKSHDIEYGEIDIGLDALNSGVVFSKTRAFENAREAFESPTSQRKIPSLDSLKHWRNKGGKGRRHDVCLELHLIKMKFQHETYPEHTEQASRQVLVIHTMEIHDRLQSSNYNKMLYLFSSPHKPKQSHANMVVIKAAHIRPDPQLNIEECSLKVSLLPIRLNVDQDALLFVHQFFGDITPKSEIEGEEERSKPQSHHSSLENLPVMTVQNNAEDDLSKRHGQENLLIFDESPIQDDNVSTSSREPSIDSTKTSYPIYFRQIIFTPEVPIRIDYTGKRLDMTHGPLAGFLMCLAQLNNSEIQLKALNYRNGILGVDRLLLFMVTEWGNDIKKTQLPSLLGGIGPLYSFVQIFQGVRDLFWLPIEQYQKDGRITKGIQRGATAFSTSTAMAALELTNRLVQTIQSAAEFTYEVVSPGPSMQQQRQLSTRKKRLEKPGDIRGGVTNAYHVLREGFGDTAKTIVRVATKEHEQKGLSGAVGGVLRQIAPTVCVPIILSSQATSSLLDGFKSQLQPESKKDAAEKWKQF